VGTYVFDNSWEQERERLAGLEAANDTETIQHLETLGVGPGWSCLEIAAGGGSIAQWLCRRVAPSGKVVATDIDTRFLEILDEPNLDVRRHNLISEDLPEDEFDLIHGRFIVEYLPDREQIVKKLVSALKPGGWILLEDADFSPLTSQPPRTMMYPDSVEGTASKVWRAALEIVRRTGADDEYGRRLPIDMITAGLADVAAEIHGFFRWGGSPASAASVGTLEMLREQLTSSTDIADEEIDQTIAFLSDPEQASSGPLVVRAWGRRPQADKRGGEARGMPPRTETVRSWLRTSPLFANTSEVELSRIASLADELHVDAGERLTIEGEPGNTFMVIAKGTATVSRGGARLAALGPGSYFGEIALIEQGPRTATVTADSRMWLFVFDASGFASLMNGIPVVADEIFRALARRKQADRGSRKKR
jgi:SAM-dependent methyltransferase